MSSALLPPAAQAETLLQTWEQSAVPPATAAYAAACPARLAQLAALCATLRPETAISIDYEDIRAVLGSAAHFRIGTAAATGPNRAQAAAQAVLAALQPLPDASLPGPAQRALLSIISPAAQPLEMDELDTIVGTIQRPLGQDVELIFGHDETEDAAESELRVWLLVGYGAAT